MPTINTAAASKMATTVITYTANFLLFECPILKRSDLLNTDHTFALL